MFYQRLTRPELGARRLFSFKTDNPAGLLCWVLDGKVVWRDEHLVQWTLYGAFELCVSKSLQGTLVVVTNRYYLPEGCCIMKSTREMPQIELTKAWNHTAGNFFWLELRPPTKELDHRFSAEKENLLFYVCVFKQPLWFELGFGFSFVLNKAHTVCCFLIYFRHKSPVGSDALILSIWKSSRTWLEY